MKIINKITGEICTVYGAESTNMCGSRFFVFTKGSWWWVKSNDWMPYNETPVSLQEIYTNPDDIPSVTHTKEV